MVLINTSRSIGLPTWSTMPAAMQASLSDCMALAVMAMMGTACMLGCARRRRVASRPSMSGICMSIKIASKGGCASRACATPSMPPPAISMVAPLRSSNSRAICWFSRLSSTTKSRKPARRGPLSVGRRWRTAVSGLPLRLAAASVTASNSMDAVMGLTK